MSNVVCAVLKMNCILLNVNDKDDPREEEKASIVFPFWVEQEGEWGGVADAEQLPSHASRKSRKATEVEVPDSEEKNPSSPGSQWSLT